jgi:hypothetical protein
VFRVSGVRLQVMAIKASHSGSLEELQAEGVQYLGNG